jgi:hypothetical protein
VWTLAASNPGDSASIRATMPLTWAVAIDEPEVKS